MELTEQKSEDVDTDLLSGFFENFRRAIRNTGISPYTLSRKFGFSAQTLSKLLKENKDPKFSTIVRVAGALNLSIDQMLGKEISGDQAPVSEPAPQTPSVSDPSVESGSASSISMPEALWEEERASLAALIPGMGGPDVELLFMLAGFLNERRARTLQRLTRAVEEQKRKKKLFSGADINSDDDDDDDDDGDDDDEEYDN